MRNVIAQIIQLYPGDIVQVTMESGENLSGRPGFLFPPPDSNPDSGLFILLNNQGVPTEAVSLCRLAAIGVTSAVYNDSITYLPETVPPPTGCDADCEAAIRAFLPVGTVATIEAGNTVVANGTVRKSEFGMTVVVGNNDSNPAFVSNCKIDVITF